MAAQWKKMAYYAFRLPNRPGELARFAQQTRDAGINLLGLWGYAPGVDEPMLSCVPDSSDTFRQFAKSDNWPGGGNVEEGHMLYLCADDTAGALVEVLQRIADADINVESIECVATGDRFGCFLWTERNDLDQLERILTGSA